MQFDPLIPINMMGLHDWTFSQMGHPWDHQSISYSIELLVNSCVPDPQMEICCKGNLLSYLGENSPIVASSCFCYPVGRTI
jgi:hypothetical protein